MFKIEIKIFLTLHLFPLLVQAIIGGSRANPHEFPWIVQLQDRCGGTIIAKNLVITAAHCVEDINKSYKDELFIYMGHSDLKSSLIKKEKVKSILIHPQWNTHRWYAYDIALLRLSKDIEFNNFVQPIALPNEGITGDYGGLMIAAGWGLTLDLKEEINFFKNGSIPWQQKDDTIQQRARHTHNLMKLKMTLSECSRTNWIVRDWTSIGDIGFCAAGREPSIQGVCNGDSGSPLMTKINGQIQIIGIASASWCFGPNNVFVNVGIFVPWIQRNLDKFVDPYYNLLSKKWFRDMNNAPITQECRDTIRDVYYEGKDSVKLFDWTRIYLEQTRIALKAIILQRWALEYAERSFHKIDLNKNGLIELDEFEKEYLDDIKGYRFIPDNEIKGRVLLISDGWSKEKINKKTRNCQFFNPIDTSMTFYPNLIKILS